MIDSISCVCHVIKKLNLHFMYVLSFFELLCSRKFLKKLNTYTKWRFNFFIMRQTRKIESIFKLKDKNSTRHTSFTKASIFVDKHTLAKQGNFEIRVNEHSDVNKQSEPAKHIRKHLNHKFTWEVLITVH